MRFQSKFRNYKLMYRTARWGYMPDQSRYLIPGITVEFSGPQRIFDSTKHGWDDETRNAVEDFVLSNKNYGTGIYLAAGQELPVEKQDVARVKPKEVKRFCKAIGFDDNGELVQCKTEPSVGRDYCQAHDSQEPKIVKGMGTTVDQA